MRSAAGPSETRREARFEARLSVRERLRTAPLVVWSVNHAAKRKTGSSAWLAGNSDTTFRRRRGLTFGEQKEFVPARRPDPLFRLLQRGRSRGLAPGDLILLGTGDWRAPRDLDREPRAGHSAPARPLAPRPPTVTYPTFRIFHGAGG